jgi:antirestriction protein ArdC
MNADTLYHQVTNDLIARIEQGTDKWEMPWTRLGGASPIRMTGQPYRGVNWLILSLAQTDHGYRSPQWGTFKAWLAKGTKTNPVCVRKGEKGTAVFLWKKEQPSAKRLAADPEAQAFLLARTFTVFNRDQVDGLPPLPEPEQLSDHERWAHADEYFAAIGATVTEHGDRAAYAPVGDYIMIPTIGQFAKRDDFYSTLAHEHTHWTGHETRLDRQLRNRFGDQAYAAEELIAELGSAFWGAQMGIAPAKRTDHAAYLGHWLSILKSDHKAIVTAASKAQQAVDFLNEAAGYTITDDDADLATA